MGVPPCEAVTNERVWLTAMAPVRNRELGLADLLQALGQELRNANQRAEVNKVATLAWTEATVEVALEVKTTAKGGIKFAVMGIGAEGGADRGTGRTIRAQVHCVPAEKHDASPRVGIDFGGARTMASSAGSDIVGGDHGNVR
jgi:hypothetical protein